MKTRILCALLAICLMVVLLPMTVFAEDPSITVKFGNATLATGFSLTIAPGQVKYVASTAEKQFAAWDKETPPSDNFVKLEYPADGTATLQVTLKNVDVDNSSCDEWNYHSIHFEAGEYGVVLNLLGVNKLSHDRCSCIFYEAAKGMIITGSGSLATNNTGANSGSIWARGGNLLIQNTTLDLTCAQVANNPKYNAILAACGNVTIEGSKITYSTDGGSLIFMGTLTEKVGRYTLDQADDRFITIKDSEITGSASLATFSSKNPCIIINSTLELKKNSSSTDPDNAIFYPTPKLEGDFGAWGGTAKKPENAKQYDLTSKNLWSSSTYIKLVPGKFEIPEETQPAETKPAESKPVESKPVESKPVETTPVETEPVETTPVETEPVETTPVETEPVETTPVKTEPVETTPTETTPNETEPKDTHDDDQKSGSPLKVVLIILIVLIVAAGGAVGVIFYLKKKKA